MNVLALAYLGDAVYELYVRNYLIKKVIKLYDIQTESLKYVSAKSQKKHLDKLIEINFLTEDELDIIRRGRNAKGGKSKSADIKTYRLATGFECLFGKLYLDQNIKRIEEIIKKIVGD